MSGVATAIVGGAVIGGAVSYLGSQNAANAETSAANTASNTETGINNTNNALEAPFRQSGIQNLNTLNSMMPQLDQQFTPSMYQQSPAYQAQLQAGLQAVTASSAARGTLGGGDTGKALMNYGTQAANADYQQAFNNYTTQNTNTYNRLAGLAGLGQTATQTSVGANTATGNQISQNIQSGANATAAGDVAGANSISSAIGAGTNAWMQNQYLQAITANQTGNAAASTSGSGYGLGANVSNLNQTPTWFYGNQPSSQFGSYPSGS